MSPNSKAHGPHVTERSAGKDDTCLTTDDRTTHHRHTNSADEGIAELDGPTSVPVLLELLREKDDRIQVLGENILRVSVEILQSCKILKDNFLAGNFDLGAERFNRHLMDLILYYDGPSTSMASEGSTCQHLCCIDEYSFFAPFQLEQTLLQEGTSRNLAIRAVSVPK